MSQKNCNNCHPILYQTLYTATYLYEQISSFCKLTKLVKIEVKKVIDNVSVNWHLKVLTHSLNSIHFPRSDAVFSRNMEYKLAIWIFSEGNSLVCMQQTFD